MTLSYHERLTLRLAEGMGKLSPDIRNPHVMWLKQAQNADGGFSGREGPSDLYYTSFALRGLAIAGELTGEVAERAARFLEGRLRGQAPIIDFLSLIYGAALLDSATGIDVFRAAPANWRKSVASELERFRRPDGGYAKTEEGQSSSTYHTFLVTLCSQILGEDPIEPARLVAFVASRRREDGGFVEIGPMRKSGANPTAAAMGLLGILNAVDAETKEGAIDFLANAQNDEGGLLANTRVPLADTLSTFSGLLTLADLDALSEIDARAARAFVLGAQFPDCGFRGGVWDGGRDVEYTFYGLGALALLADVAH